MCTNSTAKLTRIRFYVLSGRIAPDDVEAVKAISGEVRDLLDLMQNGIRDLNVKAVRDAADRARSVSQMLAPNAQARVQEAVDIARATARQIVKAGEQVAQEVDLQAIRKINEARTAFLDLDQYRDVAAPEAEGRAVDLTPEVPVVPTHEAGAARQVELS